jgi:hypothetical protein
MESEEGMILVFKPLGIGTTRVIIKSPSQVYKW